MSFHHERLLMVISIIAWCIILVACSWLLVYAFGHLFR